MDCTLEVWLFLAWVKLTAQLVFFKRESRITLDRLIEITLEQPWRLRG